MQHQTLLHRQVHPTFAIHNIVATQAFEDIGSPVFIPKPADQGKLSVYNGDIFNCEDAYSHYTKQGLSSYGVVSVSVQECSSLDLKSVDDNIPFTGHAYIDYSELDKRQIKIKARNH